MIDHNKIALRFSNEDVVYFSFLVFLLRQFNVSKALNNKLVNLKLYTLMCLLTTFHEM